MLNLENDLAAFSSPLGTVTGEVLKLWSVVEDLDERYERFVTDSITYQGAKAPIGYVGKKKHATPVKTQQLALIIAVSKVKFEKRYNPQEACNLLLDAGVQVSRSGLLKVMMRVSDALGITDLIPKGRLVKIESLADAERLVQAARKNYAKDAIKQGKSPEEIREDLGVKTKPKRKKKLERVLESKDALEDNEDFKGREIVYEPTAKQVLFHAASETIVLYGGSAGGGKSYALVFDAIRYAHVPRYRAVIIRRTMPELMELIETSKEFYPKLHPGAKFNTQKNLWRFPSGAIVEFGYLDKSNDKLRYQGQQYQYIAFDELGQWPDAEGWNYLKSRLRAPEGEKAIKDPATGQPIHLAMRATSNPGASWVKEMFIDAAEANTTFYDRAGVTHKFIPASLLDNPYLGEGYRKMLESLPEMERRQLLYGDWNATDSAAFPEFRPEGTTSIDIHGEATLICEPHVIEPFEIPKWWNRVAGMDYGYRDPATAVWYAINPTTGQKIVYKEYCESGKTGTAFGLDIKAMEADEVLPIDHPLDWSVFNKTGHTGPTIGEEIRRTGVTVRPADKNRIGGKVQIHEHLRPMGDSTVPGLVFFNTCTGIIGQLKAAQIKPTDPDDIDQTRVGETRKHHWDLYDSLRYGLMARPTRQNRAAMFKDVKQQSRWDRVNDYFS